MGVGCLHGLGVQAVPRPDHQIIGVERRAGDVEGRALVRHAEADEGVGGTFGQVAHTATPLSSLEEVALVQNLRSDCSSIAAR